MGGKYIKKPSLTTFPSWAQYLVTSQMEDGRVVFALFESRDKRARWDHQQHLRRWGTYAQIGSLVCVQKSAELALETLKQSYPGLVMA